MNFYDVLAEMEEGQSLNPFAGRVDGDWVEGTISIDFLSEHFGHLETAEEMKKATESEGLKLYFDWLKQKGILN